MLSRVSLQHARGYLAGLATAFLIRGVAVGAGGHLGQALCLLGGVVACGVLWALLGSPAPGHAEKAPAPHHGEPGP
jgi:hypothetical protein